MKRYRLTRSTYRRVEGWQIISVDSRPWRMCVFFEHESAARRTIAKLRADHDYEISLDDFEPAA